VPWTQAVEPCRERQVLGPEGREHARDVQLQVPGELREEALGVRERREDEQGRVLLEGRDVPGREHRAGGRLMERLAATHAGPS
jgi:hypothetical protein